MSETFTYRCTHSFDLRTSVISRELAEQLADAFEAQGLNSEAYPFLQEIPTALLGKLGRPRLPRRYETNAELVALVDGLGLSREPWGEGEFKAEPKWTFDVSAVLDQRAAQRRLEAKRQAANAQTNPAVRAYLLGVVVGYRGRFEPKADDLSWMVAKAQEDRRRPTTIKGERVLLGPTPYTPKDGCPLRLKLKAAVHFGYTQEAYADHQEWVIPVEGEATDEQMLVCRANLGAFAEALRTANGLAGYGSNYSFALVRTTNGLAVIVNQRSSIAD